MSRQTVNYDALAASAPIDRQAAIARDGTGQHYGASLPAHVEHWSAPPPPERAPSRDLPRLEGHVFGQGMRVVRYHGKRWNGARWLVRCVCGGFELRSTQAIRTAPSNHVCHLCQQTRSLAITLDRRRDGPDWKASLPTTFKMRWSEAELRFALAATEGRIDPAVLSATDRTALAARIRDRLSGLEPKT